MSSTALLFIHLTVSIRRLAASNLCKQQAFRAKVQRFSAEHLVKPHKLPSRLIGNSGILSFRVRHPSRGGATRKQISLEPLLGISGFWSRILHIFGRLAVGPYRFGSARNDRRETVGIEQVSWTGQLDQALRPRMSIGPVRTLGWTGASLPGPRNGWHPGSAKNPR